jgi:hypothetical protein
LGLGPRYGRAEAQQVALDATTSDAAADRLRAWFTDRLTVDPGHPGPFGDLAFDLINAALGLVDWIVVAAEIRADSYDPGGAEDADRSHRTCRPSTRPGRLARRCSTIRRFHPAKGDDRQPG